VIVEQDGLERLAHVPFEIVGEHAQQHMGAHTASATMMDRPDLEIDGLEAAERPEQKLQSKAGYIDARPQTDSSTKTSCNARPDHTSGSKAPF
jgi:hypothetical protein